jgi:hypothetical protein
MPEEQPLLDAADDNKKKEINPYIFLYIEIGILVFGFLLMGSVWGGITHSIGFSIVQKATSVYFFIATFLYIVHTFRKPQFHTAQLTKRIFGSWNLIQFSILFLTYQLRLWEWASIVIYSCILYFTLLSIWEAKNSPTEKATPIFLFHIGIALFLFAILNPGSPFINDMSLFILIIEGVSFLLMLSHILQNKLKNAAFIFYIPRQIAILLLCLFLYWTN